MTEYGLAPINSDPRFTVAATPSAVGTSRWLAPELINPPSDGSNMPVMESKAADVFAFGIFAAELYTGAAPFETETPVVAAQNHGKGKRPEMSENAQQGGLTDEIWKLLERCWEQKPKKRPTMEEVVRRWQGFEAREFANSALTPEQSRQRAGPLLNSKDLLREFRALIPEDQTKFIDKVDKVRRGWLILLSQYPPSIISAKAYPTIHSPDAKYVTALGEVCSATELLPTSALLSTGLEKRGNIAVASGGFTDIWRGEYYSMQAAIKAFRIYPAQNLKEAKEVSIRSISEVCSCQTKSLDSVEASPDLA